jgi:multidrug efflux pump subunit AcrA (membrane-fusion protein)
MSSIPHKRTLALGLLAAVLLAVVAWAAGGAIRSPAQVAADTAPPKPSLITVPVEQRTLTTEVIVRGTMRYGSPQAVELATSALKPGTPIVSVPPRAGVRLREGKVALVLSDRPVFVMLGTLPMHRDLAPGTSGPDVLQLERALARAGFGPGAVDGRYDGATGAAVAAYYARAGWAPFGPTEAQADQLRTARTTATTARDALLQARVARQAALRSATPAEVSQARLDASTAAQAVPTAAAGVIAARTKAVATRHAATRALAAVVAARAAGAKDVTTAQADLSTKESALNAAVAALQDAQFKVDHPPPDTRAQDLEALRTALRRANDAVPVARGALEAKQSALAAAQAAESGAQSADPPSDAATLAKARSDVVTAQADVVSAQADLNAALDAQVDAQAKVDNPPPDTRPADLQALQAALQQAKDALPLARRDVDSARDAVAAAQASERAAVAQAVADAGAARADSRQAVAEVVGARSALVAARHQASLARGRVAILARPADTGLQRRVVAAAAAELRRAEGDATRIASRSSIQVPADEVLFFPTLPRRIDRVTTHRGASPNGPVMTVSSSRLVADSSLAISDAKLVRVGAPVTIEEQDLGIKVQGRVTEIASKPGTNRVDPTRVHFVATPAEAPARLVGASVKLTIAVRSTKGDVLAVPLSAVSVGADGSSRVQVDRGGGRTAFVRVLPGLASDGLVEVRSAQGALAPGDLVVVGSAGSSSSASLPSSTGISTPTTGTGTGTGPATGTVGTGP